MFDGSTFPTLDAAAMMNQMRVGRLGFDADGSILLKQCDVQCKTSSKLISPIIRNLKTLRSQDKTLVSIEGKQ